ncbi:hypothetical protein [Burkholderia ambifaria]|uniref:hypothetical protein n=1 Tax=Burkholderia ambifaria TaxID=152480 RepID=UPI002FE34F18
MTFNASDIAADLRMLGDILFREQICLDIQALEEAARICSQSAKDEWQYHFTDLVLDVGGTGVKCYPTNLREIKCRLDVKVGGKCIPGSTAGDPLFNTMVSIILKSIDHKSGITYSQAWHLDRQPDRATPHCAHPRYHINFGGRRLTELLDGSPGPQYTNLLLIDSPRMAHAPLDGILAIDFILSNLAGPKWKVLRTDPDYVRVISAAQERLWRPYVNALAAHMNRTHSLWNALEVWPQLH